jgi:hypothetical protein
MFKSSLYSILFVLFVLCALPAHAAEPEVTFTLRTDLVASINSIALTSASSSVIWSEGADPIALHRIDFSIEAFEDDVFVPLAASRGPSDQVGVEYVIESRGGSEVAGGVALGTLIAHQGTTGPLARIEKGTTGMFTLLVAFKDAPNHGREDRVRVTGSTIATSIKSAELNRYELDDLISPYTEFTK